MKKIPIIVIIIIIATVAIVLGLRFLTPEDTWLCQDGQWVKHGNPSAPKPTEPCNGQPETEVIIYTPQPNQVVISPLTVEGKAKGGWFFEANAILRLLDGQGNEIAIGNVQATTDWMTANYVEFKGQLSFSYNATSSGILVFHNDNPSGLPENDKEFQMPIKLVPTETIKIKAFFNNDKLDPQISCNKVFPVEREIPKTQAVAKVALEELLKGPTADEKIRSYVTNINQGVKIQKLTVDNGVARVDFDETLEQAVGGSCRVAAIRAQITQTLKQFSTVKSVIISINGRTEDILQP